MLLVTIREGEERRICSSALNELVKIIKDQIEERSEVVFVLNQESAVWKDSSVKALSRGDELKFFDHE